MKTTIIGILVSALALVTTMAHAAESQTTPHPVPWEFASDRYNVTVNGKPATVFFATMNLHFASFDFTGQADIQVTINENDYNRRDGKTYLKAGVKAREPSDPYLMAGYDLKTLTLSHDARRPVEFTVEVDFYADGQWHEYRRFTVEPGRPLQHEFPEGYAAHWLRVRTSADCTATSQCHYE